MHQLNELVARIIARAEPDGECLIWTGALNTSGYPVVKHAGRAVLATRAVLRWKLGRAIKARRLACHTCDRPSCVNPEHLEEGTFRRNLREAWARRRRSRPSTFTEE